MRIAKTKRIFVLMLGLLSARLSFAQSTADPDVDYGPLGKGTFEVSFQQAPSGDVVLELSTDLAPVVGIVAGTDGRNLVAVISGDAQGRARHVLAGVEAETKLEIGGSTLAGQRPQVVLPSDLHGVKKVRLTLIGQDGKKYPLVFQGSDLQGAKITTSFSGLAGNCHEVSLTCSNGCKKSETCCSLLVCVGCTKCEILCGQSCLPASPAE